MTERNAEGETLVPTDWEHFGLGVLARGYGFDQPAAATKKRPADCDTAHSTEVVPVPRVFPSYSEDRWSRIVRWLTLLCRHKERIAGGVLSQQHVLSVQTDPADPETRYQFFKICSGQTELGYQIQWQERLLDRMTIEVASYRVSNGVVSRLESESPYDTLPSTGGEYLVSCIPSLRTAVEAAVFRSTKKFKRLLLRVPIYDATMKLIGNRVPPPDRE